MAEQATGPQKQHQGLLYETTADPSALTMDLVRREMNGIEKFFEMRLGEMDKAVALFHANLVRVPTDTDKQILHLRELVEGKFETIVEKFTSVAQQFESIQMQFKERDTRTEQIARGNETALTAALNAAKEAVSQQNIAFTQATSKAEAGFIKQIDQLVALFQTGMKALDEKISTATKTSDDKIANVEKQLTMLVGTGTGQLTAQTSHQASSGNLVALIGVIAGAVGVIGVILVAALK